MDAGMRIEDVAAGFVDSPAFQALYGSNPTAEHLLTLLYNNVLHRAPDQGGYDWWVGEFDAGRVTLATALVGFSKSPEHQAGVIGVIQNGIALFA